MPSLEEIHGTGNCHICGKPKAGEGDSVCSYPHGMVPAAPVDPSQPNGFWAWEQPKT